MTQDKKIHLLVDCIVTQELKVSPNLLSSTYIVLKQGKRKGGEVRERVSQGHVDLTEI